MFCMGSVTRQYYNIVNLLRARNEVCIRCEGDKLLYMNTAFRDLNPCVLIDM